MKESIKKINVLIFCDILLYREGLQLVLCEQPDIKLMCNGENSDHFLDHVRSLQSAVVLIDARMPEALVTIREVSSLGRAIKVIALTISETNTQHEVLACAEAGAASYLTSNATVSDLLQAIRGAEKNELHCSPKIAGALVQHVGNLAMNGYERSKIPHLTKREVRVLDEIEHGMSNKDIARKLCIEVTTVKNHVHHILEKLSVRRRGEAAVVMQNLRTAGYEKISGH